MNAGSSVNDLYSFAQINLPSEAVTEAPWELGTGSLVPSVTSLFMNTFWQQRPL